MTIHNAYLAYKRDTRYLTYWITHASNAIIQKSSSEDKATLNHTGQVTVSDLGVMVQRIADRARSIPDTIYRLFKSVINARLKVHAVFKEAVEKNPDVDVEKSNSTHKHFIDILEDAFKVLGGETWEAQQNSRKNTSDEEAVDEVIFSNTFAALNLGNDASKESDDESDENKIPAQPQHQKKHGNGAKGKKKKKKTKQRNAPVQASPLEDVPLESYRIIDDTNGIVTDYLIAVYSILEEICKLRQFVSNIWNDVAYNKLNSATAAVLSNMAIAMVQRTEAAIFVDFPGHDSYNTVLQTITRGNMDWAKTNFRLELHAAPVGTMDFTKHSEAYVDLEEQFLANTYQYLLDFITDFQLTRSGKPTKRMAAELRNWDPKFDPSRASKDDRMKWRRAYIINWLYDLVNVYSSVVIQRVTLSGEKHVLENVDWTINGPWGKIRRLFGLNEFAGFVTSLAMQKPGKKFQSRILPNHVFQLQCIIDAFTVSRGWSHNMLGHKLVAPARGFCPRRDVDLFLDRERKVLGHGWQQGVEMLALMFEKDARSHGEERRHSQKFRLVHTLFEEFRDWLGESKYAAGLQTIPPSRFANSNSNGLWDYSPYLCGVGLMEALELAYAMGMSMFDRCKEPVLLVHLHNMLNARGYIQEPVGLYDSLLKLFPTSFFLGGRVPRGGSFASALSARMKELTSRANAAKVRSDRAKAPQKGNEHSMLSSKVNTMFQQKSNLQLYHEADWNPDKIPDSVFSSKAGGSLAALRIARTPIQVDALGVKRLERTELVRIMLARGVPEEALVQAAEELSGLEASNRAFEAEKIASFQTSMPEFTHSAESDRMPHGKTRQKDKYDPQGEKLLDFLKKDIHSDISGDTPLSGINYIWILARMHLTFVQIEEELKAVRNVLWVAAYESGPGELDKATEKRLDLTAMALEGGNDECLRIMARVLQNPRPGLTDHVYWDKLSELDELMPENDRDPDEPPEPQCSIM